MSIQSWVETNFDISHNTSDGNDLTVNCPKCGDTKQHLYISKIKPTFHCFKCDWAGTHFQLVREISGAESAIEIWHELSRPAHSIADFESIADRLKRAKYKPAASVNSMPSWFHTFDGNVTYSGILLNYALRRLPADKILRYGLGYCADGNNSLALRLILPIEDGYYQARALTNKSMQKYLNPEFPVGYRLFNYPALEIYNTVVICEGAFSAIAAGKNAVATLGKKANPEQLYRLGNSKAKKFIIAYDAGEERSAKALELAEHLAVNGKTVVMRSYAFGDPDECDIYTDCEYSGAYNVESCLMKMPKQRRLNFTYS